MTALIIGVTGQDGAYLAARLIRDGVRVVGTTRDAASADRSRLIALGINDQVSLVCMRPANAQSVFDVVNAVRPRQIYFLAGQSSVALSFEQPVQTMESIATGMLNVLEAVRAIDTNIRVLNAGSSECFGDTDGEPATEQTPFRPLNPYATAKACAQHLLTSYRLSYGIRGGTAILFNHESPLRPERFVTQKIVYGARSVAAGEIPVLKLGNLDVIRDWGWSPDYVEAMVKMLDRDAPEDFVIATGKSVPLAYFVERAFRNFGLDWREHVVTDAQFKRPTDVAVSAANPVHARNVLGWQATHDLDYVVDAMCDAARSSPTKI